MIEAPLLPPNQRPYQHPALVTDPNSPSNYFKIVADPLDQFSVGSGLALFTLIGLVICTLVIFARQSTHQFYKFFHIKKPHKLMQLKPFKTSSQEKIKPSSMQKLSFAFKTYKPLHVYIMEKALRFVLLIVCASCLSMAIQWNKCLSRINANYSFKCLNEGNPRLRDPFIGGVVVGAIVFIFYSGYDKLSWISFQEYLSIFKIESNQIQLLQQELFKKIESDIDKQSVTTMGPVSSERNGLIGLMGEKETVPALKKFKDLNELVQIDEDEDDEHCSPVKPRGKYASPVKRFKPNDSIRSEEHISPTKGAIQFNQLDGNESADDGDLVIRTRKVDQLQDLSKSVQSIQISQQDQKESKPKKSECNSTTKKSKRQQIFVYSAIVIALTVVLFMIMVALYFFANASQLGLKIMWKSVGVAIAADFILSVPFFIKNYKRANTFLAQDPKKFEVIMNFWQTYEVYSERLADKTEDNEAKLKDEQSSTFTVRIGQTTIEYEAPNLFESKPQPESLFKVQTQKQESSNRKGSKSLFSPRSSSLGGGEVVPISGSASFMGEAPPSQRSIQNNKLKISHTNVDDQSDPSIEEIGQSPNKNLSPKAKKNQTSVTKPIFSSTKKQHQFETPKPSGTKISSQKELIPEAQLPTFNLPEVQQKNSEDLLSLVLSPSRIEPRRIEENKFQLLTSLQRLDRASESSQSRSPLQGLKKLSQIAGEGVKNLIRNISKSGMSMISKKTSQADKIEKSEQKVDSHRDRKDEQYSPMWSSVKRETKSQLVKYRPGTEEGKLEVEEVLSNNLPSLKELHTINQKSEEDSPQASKRLAYADIKNAEKSDSAAGRSYKKRKFNSPNSLQRSFREATGDRGEQLSQRGSQSKYGEHTTARKRRLMMLEDAAGSSINFKNNSAGVVSIAHHTHSSIMRDTRQIHYQSLGSVCSDLRKNESNGLLSSNKDMPKNDSQVMIGAGEIDEDKETMENLISEAYQNQNISELVVKNPAINIDAQKSVPIQKLAHSKSRKVEILRADSEVDSASVHQHSALNNYQTSERSNNISPNNQQISAFQKLVKSSQQVIENGRNGKRSHSVNQTTGMAQFQKKGETTTNVFKQPVNLKSEIRRSSEPSHQLDEKTTNTVLALKVMSKNLTKQTQNTSVVLNKISIDEFKTQQEQRVDQQERVTREGARKNKQNEQDNYNSIGGQVSKLNAVSRYSQRQGLQTEKENKVPVSRKVSRGGQQTKSQQPPGSKQVKERQQINTSSTYENKPDPSQNYEFVNPSEGTFDLGDYEKYTDEELENIHKISQMNSQQHFQDQRRRLEHFLAVAKQAHARQDVQKIQQLLKELHENGKSLPSNRINELKNLDIMTSPYNQTLISMLKVENAQLRRFKELQTQQQILKGKYSLPKNFSTGGSSQTGFKPSLDKLKELSKIAGVDQDNEKRFRNQRQSNSGERSASSIERAMLANTGNQILEGENSARSYGFRQGSNASDVYQINTRFEPLQRNEYQFAQPKSVLNYSKPELITFENLKVEDMSANKHASPASIYKNY